MKKSYWILLAVAALLISSQSFAVGSAITKQTLKETVLPAITSIIPVESATKRYLAGEIVTTRFIPALIINPGFSGASNILGKTVKLPAKYETVFFNNLRIGIKPPDFWVKYSGEASSMDLRKKQALQAMAELFVIMESEPHSERNVFIGLINALSYSQVWLSTKMIQLPTQEAKTSALSQVELTIAILDFITSPEAINSFENGKYAEIAAAVEKANLEINHAFSLNAGQTGLPDIIMQPGSESFTARKIGTALDRVKSLLAFHYSESQTDREISSSIDKLAAVYLRLIGEQSDFHWVTEEGQAIHWTNHIETALKINDVAYAVRNAASIKSRLVKDAASPQIQRTVPNLGSHMPAMPMDGSVTTDPLNLIGHRLF